MPDPARLVQAAEAVVALLNTPGAFSQSFTAARNYPTWKVPLTKIGPLRVDVIASSHPISELDTREANTYNLRIIVLLRRKFSDAMREEQTAEGRKVSNESIDELVKLIEEIAEYFQDTSRRVLTNDLGDIAKWKETKILNTMNDAHLQQCQYTGLIRVDYVT